MATIVKFSISGATELQQLFEELQNDFGAKDQKGILRKATRDSMKPVLQQAKTLSPKDTGLLQSNLFLYARPPSKKDQQSKYIGSNSSMIAVVATKKIPKKLKNEMKGKTREERKKFYTSKGYIYDGRATAMEFGFKHFSTEMGTAKYPGKPYLRPALESQSQNVLDILGDNLKMAIEKYRAKKGK